MTTRHTVRPVRAHEWREIRALRLRALSEEAAPMAFVESHGDAAARPDGFWQGRAQASSLEAGPPAGARQFVAVTDDGTWVGTAAVLIEEAGDADFAGRVVEEAGGHVVGVFPHPEHRGRGSWTACCRRPPTGCGSGDRPARGSTSMRTTAGHSAATRGPGSGPPGTVHRHDGARDRDDPRSLTPTRVVISAAA